MNRRIKSVHSTALSLLGALILIVAHSVAFAGPHYLFSYGDFGDTAFPVDLNDRGAIAWAGFGDSYVHGASWANGDFVNGYGDAAGCIVCGVDVTDINNAGDLFGSALKNGVWVPTIWLAGVPYDLTDPANAGLLFHYDPGPKYANDFNLWELDVLGLPDFFNPDSVSIGGNVLTNARGDFVFGYFAGPFESFGLLTVVPEPATLALLGIGLAGLGFARRKRELIPRLTLASLRRCLLSMK